MDLLRYIRKAILFIEKALFCVERHRERHPKNKIREELPASVRAWTGKVVELVEVIYALDTYQCVDNGTINIIRLCADVSHFFGIEIKDCYGTYVEMKKRKAKSRTYFLDELSRRLNERMDADDEKMR